jgi:hypothetical protein
MFESENATADVMAAIQNAVFPKADELAEIGRQPLRQYRGVNISELLQHEFPAREYILSPAFTLGSLNMIYAWRGIGKTHVALGIAYAAACGGRFLNWTAARPFRVLYLDGEMPGETLQARLAAIVQAADTDPPEDFLRFITIDLEGGIMPDLATREGHAQIAGECEQAELIVVDNLSCLVRGSGKENEANTWTEAAEWGLSMRSKGKAVLFVHHAGKDGAQRGTSKREDLLDVSISLKRPSDYDPDQGARFELRFEKARHLTGADSAPFEAWLKADEQGRQAWTVKPISETTFERVVELANLGMTQKEIADEIGIDKSNVCRAWKKAQEQGLIPQAKQKSSSKASHRKDADD